MDWLGHSNAPTSGPSSQGYHPVVILFLCACSGLAASCSTVPDPHEVEGVLAFAARAIEDADSAELYRVIDVRARHALHSIVKDRREAAEIVRDAYPEAERSRALAELGDAALAEDARDLFVRRCDAACRDAIGSTIGGVERREEHGDELWVRTSRGQTVRLYRAEVSHWWGIVWNTEALDRERARANQDRLRVQANAETYRRRAQLEGREVPPAPDAEAVDRNDAVE